MFGTATFFTNPRKVTMLVLSRKIGERLVIGTGIVITLEAIQARVIRKYAVSAGFSSSLSPP
jgi:hypothetical protein